MTGSSRTVHTRIAYLVSLTISSVIDSNSSVLECPVITNRLIQEFFSNR